MSKSSQEIAVIALGASQSQAIRKPGYTIVGIIMPAAWTAADITFLVSNNPTTGFVKLVQASDEAEITSKASASESIVFNGAIKEALALGVYFKIRSGIAATPVNQTAGANLTIIFEEKGK